jgi:hypothetical protein
MIDYLSGSAREKRERLTGKRGAYWSMEVTDYDVLRGSITHANGRGAWNAWILLVVRRKIK